KRDIEAALSGGLVSPVGVRSIWPSVRFSIPNVSVWGASVEGELLRDETSLILEFSVINPWGSHEEPRVLRIPLAEVLTITCYPRRQGGRSSKLSGWGKTEIVLKVYRPELLAELPVGKQGRGRLQVHRADRETAHQLVD